MALNAYRSMVLARSGISCGIPVDQIRLRTENSNGSLLLTVLLHESDSPNTDCDHCATRATIQVKTVGRVGVIEMRDAVPMGRIVVNPHLWTWKPGEWTWNLQDWTWQTGPSNGIQDLLRNGNPWSRLTFSCSEVFFRGIHPPALNPVGQ